MPSPKHSFLKSRREMLELAAAASALLIAGCDPAHNEEAQQKPTTPESPMVPEKTIPTDALMAPEALPDVVEAKSGPDGKEPPVTIVEYASMTCSHCAAFHVGTYPTLVSKYIDTGKVRFILREFPLDPLATAAFMLARCVGDDKRDALIDLLFKQQRNWAFTDKPIEALSGLVKQAGLSEESFEACLKDQDLHDKVNEVRNRAAEKFGVNATPTFFFNGIKHNGVVTPAELDALLEPLLKE